MADRRSNNVASTSRGLKRHFAHVDHQEGGTRVRKRLRLEAARPSLFTRINSWLYSMLFGKTSEAAAGDDEDEVEILESGNERKDPVVAGRRLMETIKASEPSTLDDVTDSDEVLFVKMVNPSSASASSSAKDKMSAAKPPSYHPGAINRFYGRSFQIATEEKRQQERRERRSLNIIHSLHDQTAAPKRRPFLLDSPMPNFRRSKLRFASPHSKSLAIYNDTSYDRCELEKYRSLYDKMMHSQTISSPSPAATRADSTKAVCQTTVRPPLIVLDGDEDKLVTAIPASRPPSSVKLVLRDHDSDVRDILDLHLPQKKSAKLKATKPKDPSGQSSPNTLESDLALQEVYSGKFLHELKNKYGARSEQMNTQITCETVKLRHLQERSTLMNDSLEKRYQEFLKLTDVAVEEPEPEEEEELLELPEITDQMEEVINSALRSSSGSVLVNQHSIEIIQKDIDTLRGLNWLNDSIINFYLQMIVERSQKRKVDNWPSVYAMNTFFYPKLVNMGYSSIKRWTRKVDLFSYDLILVPVHLGLHWCLATIDLKSKAVYYYDSMGGDNQNCLKVLLSYIKDEHLDKKKSPLDIDSFKAVVMKDIPQQMNGSDCGMFTCKFAEFLSRNAAISFSQQDMPYYRRRMIYEVVKNELLYP